jgi:hypothetical protein
MHRIMTLIRSLQAFFFARQRANGFGLMRIAWSSVALLFYLYQWKDVTFFYGTEGFMNPSIAHMLMRTDYHFTLLAWVTTSQEAFGLYVFFVLMLASTVVGIFPRFTTIVCALLMFSFHEGDTMVLGGGDTVLRIVGFLLMISPGIEAFSLQRLLAQRDAFRSTKTFLPPVTMSAWPYRLLLWQMIVIYGTSFWYKLLGSSWANGTAVETALHHPVFSRWPVGVVNALMPAAPAIDWLSLGWEGFWVLLLVPKWFTDLLPAQLPRIPLKRVLIVGGIVFHGSIFILMDAGSFSLAMFTAYFGLLRDDDIAWFANDFPTLSKLPITAMRKLFTK